MDAELLEEVLSCPSLPSLPAVAIRVIELTQNPDVSLDELAAAIQNDQALATKILRTVNSSFYGIRERVSSIHKALVLLGLRPVKSLALGFSLVSCVAGDEDEFDYVSYWRRGLYTAVAAKSIARAAGLDCEDEAFLGGMLQDIGMVALFRALGSRYLEVLTRTGGDHRVLLKHELAELDIMHPDVGAMLAQRWKLPDILVMPVQYHERPTACPSEHTALVRCVGLGNIAHDVLTDEDPVGALRRLHDKASQWFRLTSDRVDELVRSIDEAVREMGPLFKLDTGPFADVDELLGRANTRLVEFSKEQVASEQYGWSMASLLVDSDVIDPLSGLFTRKSFDKVARKAFEAASRVGKILSVVEVSLDGFDRFVAERGSEAGDDVFLGTVALLQKHFEPLGGRVCRFGDAEFAVVLQGVGRVAATRVAEEFRLDLGRAAPAWVGAGEGDRIGITASVGTAALERSGTFARPGQLIGAAMRAVEASRLAGGDCVRSFVPKAA